MNRAAAATMVVVLGVTAGLNVAIVDVVSSYLWRPLPYPASDRIVSVDYPRTGGPSIRDLSAIVWNEVVEQNGGP